MRSEKRENMFIKSVKLKRPKLLLSVIAAVAAALVVCLVIAAAGKQPESYILKTEEDRQQFIRDMGWETAKEYSSCRSVTIPEEFSDVYRGYNELQKQQGLRWQVLKV